MFDGVSGERVIDIPLDERFAKRFGNPYAVTHRADIHGSLLDGCKALPQLDRASHEHPRDRIPERRRRGGGRGRRRLDAPRRRPGRRRRRPLGDPRGRRRRRAAAGHGHMCYRAVLDIDHVPKDLRLPRRRWAAHNTHIVHYPLRGWKLFNLVATVIGKHTSGGHNEPDARRSARPFLALLRRAAQAHAHAEGVSPLDAPLPPASG